MPGFWIAPVHLETNPLIHMEARFKKFIKGISALNNNYKNINKISKIYNMPMQEGLNKFEDGTISGIFFDPPYGDNVPYLEFSAIWNNFIENNINYGQEIIVSDRKIYKSGWDKYQSDINNAIYLFAKKLKPSGKVIMTFNNLNLKSW
jgi:adenine-specific DNA methylase